MGETNIKGDLILIRGLHGSGKTTLGNVILKSTSIDCPDVLSIDDFFIDEKGIYNFDSTKLKEAHNDCLLRCAEKMKLEISKIVVANPFTEESEMEKYFEIANRYHYRVHSVIVENRHGNMNVHNISNDKINEMKEKFQIKL